MTYKYGTTVLVKPETKERIQSRGKMRDSFDTIITGILDKVDEYERLLSIKENRVIINRMIRELPENRQKELESMKDEEGRTKIPVDVELGGALANEQ